MNERFPNLSVIVHEMQELGIDPQFGTVLALRC